MTGICDWCCNEDDQIVILPGGWHICPACMVPEIATTLCDRCGQEVIFDPDRGDALISDSPPYDQFTRLRHRACRGLTDCTVCGQAVDPQQPGYEVIRGGPGFHAVKAFLHEGCKPYFETEGGNPGPF